ncbi:tRNA pseudouridine synthase A [Lachnospiraceae bacterium KM106-2]|nr:tRNA pseudouridine synthase A [Lachnospiraceae bacterium KM106-2]
MRNIKLIIEYDGSRYAGFKKTGPNKKGVSVQEKIEEVLDKMTGEKIVLKGAINTEPGVHALQQIANFTTESDMKEYEIKHYLNRYLPKDIAVLQVDDVMPRFQSDLNAKSAVFEYRISMAEVESVFTRKYHYYSFHRLDIGKMREAAKYLIGKQDLKAFSYNKRMKKSTEREIFDIDIVWDMDDVTITIHADDFWPYMARVIIGAIYDVGLGTITPEDVKTMIDTKDMSQAERIAEPQGLFLKEVMY